MLHFFPPGMAERYFLFSLLAVLGTLQLIATHSGWFGLALLGRHQRPWGYLLGAVLVAGAYLWFFGTSQALIFRPGLAGSELFTVFGVATAVAMALTLALVTLLHGRRLPAPVRGERLRSEAGDGIVRWPDDPGPHPAVVLVGDLPSGRFPLASLADALIARGVAVVVALLKADGTAGYPEAVARVPGLVQALQSDPRSDGRRIALVGVGLGGTLALRAAATDPSIAAVAAIDPVLDPHATGLGQLRWLTWWEALRWGRRRQRLLQALMEIDLGARLGERSTLVVHIDASGASPLTGMETVAVASAAEAVTRVVEWVTRHLSTAPRREVLAQEVADVS